MGPERAKDRGWRGGAEGGRGAGGGGGGGRRGGPGRGDEADVVELEAFADRAGIGDREVDLDDGGRRVVDRVLGGDFLPVVGEDDGGAGLLERVVHAVFGPDDGVQGLASGRAD